MSEGRASTPPTVVIIGAGLIGASIGLALTGAGDRVFLRDKVRSHAVVAAGLGAGSASDPDHDDVAMVVVSVPPAALADVVGAALEAYPNATVTDVGSVKGAVLRALRRSGGDISRYVGSHPMAGSHLSGPLTARADLFVDRTWVVTPHPDAAPERVDHVRRLVALCGSRVEVLDATEHDIAVAQVSHLPQIMSSLTAGRMTQVPESHLRLAGQGLRDVTRIAGSDPGLWQQIVAANAPAVRLELLAVHTALTDLLSVLDDPDAVRAFISRGQEGARSLPGKHGKAAADYAQVVVEIPDAPGALARLFADASEAGVNIEDLEIEHDTDREVGFLAISVAKDRAGALASAMSAAGWTLCP